jgi:hypothetical protein
MDIEDRFASLGDHLDLGDGDGSALSERVLAQLDIEAIAGGHHKVRRLRFFAAAVLIAVVAAVAVPSSRRTIAGWFGLDGVRIEGRKDVDFPDIESTGLPGPGASREETVDGRVVLVSVIEGSLADEVLVKTLGSETEIVEVDVGGSRGLWISGASHELAYRSPDGQIVFERVAGNTLVWQNDQVLKRLEGFESMGDAVEYAIGLGTDD